MDKFLCRVVMTRVINDCIADDQIFTKEVLKAMLRYKNHDWGEMSEEDKKLNDEALRNATDRILAAYETSQGKIYIITEYDRRYITILFSHEY